MVTYPDHKDNLASLKRIEGQVRGVQRMIEQGKYCVDILNQIHAAIYALARIEDKILERHFRHCVTNAFNKNSQAEKKRKLDEVIALIRQFRKI